MSLDDRPRSQATPGLARRIFRGVAHALVPTERTILTREGWFYSLVMGVLLTAGLWQQVNLVLLVATLAAGPFFSSWIGSRALLRRLSVTRRLPSSYVFSGDPLVVDYILENERRWTAALAMFMEDSLATVDRSAVSVTITPQVFFARVPARDRVRMRWEGESPRRGKYGFRDLDLGTRAPFGLVERRVTIPLPDELFVYPRIGQLSRRWFQLQRQSSENLLGQRHDRSAQQEEYHGLRDYRPGDSPRWIHWRTSARRGELMVKEFEQENELDLTILIDPWLPRTKISSEQRAAMEQAISFVATACLETCRRQGRRLLVGWTGTPAGICQGQASIKLLHELLEQLAVMRAATEGNLAELIDALPAIALRDSLMIIVSTRPVNLAEEAERSRRMATTSARNMLARAIVLNASQGDLADLIQFADASSRKLLEQRSTDQDRLASQEERRRGLLSADTDADVVGSIPPVSADGGTRT